MTWARLLLRNLFYHWRGNLAVVLGVVVGTTVLTGALLVGDSLRGSLRELTREKLGWVDEAMITGRFFRARLADELQQANAAERVAPVLLLQASALNAPSSSTDPLERNQGVRRITLLGVEDRFWGNNAAPDTVAFWKGQIPKVHLNAALARALNASVGDEVVFSVQKKSDVPPETLLGRRDEASLIDRLAFQVAGILPEGHPGANFSLSPSPEQPLNAFVPLHALQERLGQRDPQGNGQINAILVGKPHSELEPLLQRFLTLEDWGLVLRSPASRVATLQKDHPRAFREGRLRERDVSLLPLAMVKDLPPSPLGGIALPVLERYYREKRGYLSLESTQMLLEPAVANAGKAAAQQLGLRTAPTLVYLANSMANGTESIPYSIVAAIEPDLQAPLGPTLPPWKGTGEDNDIFLVEWAESPLHVKAGDSLTLSYFAPDQVGPAHEESRKLRVAGLVPANTVTLDPDLTPEFPGITDKVTIDKWDPPFPYDNRRIKPRDDQFWKDHRTAPKAFVRLELGQRLWQNRFGSLTSIRLAPAPSPGAAPDLEALATAYRHALLQELKPALGGFVFTRVKQEGLEASGGGTDFGGLFLGFSFFLIVAALLLVGLLTRLNLDRRATEVGLLLATGMRPRVVQLLYLAEGKVLALLGGFLGTLTALGYAHLLLNYLRYSWPGGSGEGLPFLTLHPEIASLAIGFIGSVLISVLTILWVVRVLRRVPPRTLLHNQLTTASELTETEPRLSLRLGVGSLIVGLILIGAGNFLHGEEERAGSFFGGGFLLLSAGLCLLWAWMRWPRDPGAWRQGMWAVARLGVMNAGRYPLRSLLTAGLLAAAAFLLVAVESFRREPTKRYLDKDSGSGGFVFLAEADLPVFSDLNSAQGRAELLDRVNQLYEKEPLLVRQRKRAEAQHLLEETRFYAFRVKAGDDASCLNLYQPRKPRVLGVPESILSRGGFAFAGTEARNNEEKAHPWQILAEPPLRVGERDIVPVFGEKNSVQWILHKDLGGKLYEDPGAEPATLQIRGLLQDSVFQSSLLLSEANFLRLYPEQQGYRFFLIETTPGHAEEVRKLLQAVLSERGFQVSSTVDRLRSYLAVENMYLSTFQALGGLGLILGSLGLAVVLLRSIWERRAELALLRALGFRRGVLSWLVLAENCFLLLVGLGLGTLAALISVAPHVLVGSGAIPWERLLVMLGGTLLVGLAAVLGAVMTAVRSALLPALRQE